MVPSALNYWGEWLNKSNRFLGFAFHINGEVHYGWARLSVSWNRRWNLSAHLTGYAYETVPNKPIIAGDTGSGSADNKSAPANTTRSESVSEAESRATLGALALGADGIAVWRPE
jgi:hypothetical protein